MPFRLLRNGQRLSGGEGVEDLGGSGFVTHQIGNSTLLRPDHGEGHRVGLPGRAHRPTSAPEDDEGEIGIRGEVGTDRTQDQRGAH